MIGPVSLPLGLLRFTTAGSVDDGKSTLIGRLLYDSKAIFEDQLAAVERATAQRGEDHLNLALLTDGLRAEREQGITIDVAYRYFATPRRKFIIADTPGHIQYTRNMVTGASTANLAIMLVDARTGIVEQTRRHAFIASLLRIPHLVLCVNKMDLVGYREEVFDRDRATSSEPSPPRLDIPDVQVHPDQRAARRQRRGAFGADAVVPGQPAALHARERLRRQRCEPRRSAVSGAVGHPAELDEHHDFRGLAGRVAGGVFKPGDEVRGAAVGPDHAHQADPRPDRAGGRGLLADDRGDDAGGRNRHQPRRHAGQAGQRCRKSARISR